MTKHSAPSSVITREFAPHMWALLSVVDATFTGEGDVPVEPEDYVVAVEAWELGDVDRELATWPLSDVLRLAGVYDTGDDDGEAFEALLATPVGRVVAQVLGPVGP